jgi:hypothetical protein
MSTRSQTQGNSDPQQPPQPLEDVTPSPPASEPETDSSADSSADKFDLEEFLRWKRQRRHVRSRSHSPEPKVTKPPEFTGKTSEFKNFIALCTLTFTMQPRMYSSGEKKVLFIIAQFRGTPLEWARDIITHPDHPLCRDYPAFIKALNNLYLDRNARLIASQKLLNLKQTSSVTSYATKFQSLAAILDYNDNFLHDMFYNKLGSDIKDRLVMMEMAPTLQGLINQAITLDQRDFQRRLEDKNSASSNKRRRVDTKLDSADSKPQSSRDNSRTNPKPDSTDSRINSKPKSSSSSAGPSKSSAPAFSSRSKPRGPLTDAEKQRRKDKGLCLYCGNPGHFADACPNLPQARQAQTSTLALDSSTSAPIVYLENWLSQVPLRQDA